MQQTKRQNAGSQVYIPLLHKNNAEQHLLNNPTNPFTCEKLTIEQLNQYNSTDIVKNKIKEFNLNFASWKKINMIPGVNYRMNNINLDDSEIDNVIDMYAPNWP